MLNVLSDCNIVKGMLNHITKIRVNNMSHIKTHSNRHNSFIHSLYLHQLLVSSVQVSRHPNNVSGYQLFKYLVTFHLHWMPTISADLVNSGVWKCILKFEKEIIYRNVTTCRHKPCTHDQICIRMQILHICKICVRTQIWPCVRIYSRMQNLHVCKS